MAAKSAIIVEQELVGKPSGTLFRAGEVMAVAEEGLYFERKDSVPDSGPDPDS